jgi:hypothetical protein
LNVPRGIGIKTGLTGETPLKLKHRVAEREAAPRRRTNERGAYAISQPFWYQRGIFDSCLNTLLSIVDVRRSRGGDFIGVLFGTCNIERI